MTKTISIRIQALSPQKKTYIYSLHCLHVFFGSACCFLIRVVEFAAEEKSKQVSGGHKIDPKTLTWLLDFDCHFDYSASLDALASGLSGLQ